MTELELNKIYCGDCVQLLAEANNLKVQLIFADPPFNIGYEYETYKDRVDYDKYVAWSEKWMSACYRVLSEDASFYIAIGDEYAAEVKMIALKLGLTLRNWIIWNYGFGQNTSKKFGRSHTHIFYFVKDHKNFVFNSEDVRVPSARQLLYNDKRADFRGRIPDDVWKYPRVCGTFKESVGWHPCQMPLKLMARIIKASSNPGDLVMDPFSGSASTLVVAAVLGRDYIGFDTDEKYVGLGQKRIIDTLASGLNEINDKEESGSVALIDCNEQSEDIFLFDLASSTETVLTTPKHGLFDVSVAISEDRLLIAGETAGYEEVFDRIKIQLWKIPQLEKVCEFETKTYIPWKSSYCPVVLGKEHFCFAPDVGVRKIASLSTGKVLFSVGKPISEDIWIKRGIGDPISIIDDSGYVEDTGYLLSLERFDSDEEASIRSYDIKTGEELNTVTIPYDNLEFVTAAKVAEEWIVLCGWIDPKDEPAPDAPSREPRKMWLVPYRLKDFAKAKKPIEIMWGGLHEPEVTNGKMILVMSDYAHIIDLSDVVNF